MHLHTAFLFFLIFLYFISVASFEQKIWIFEIHGRECATTDRHKSSQVIFFIFLCGAQTSCGSSNISKISWSDASQKYTVSIPLLSNVLTPEMNVYRVTRDSVYFFFFHTITMNIYHMSYDFIYTWLHRQLLKSNSVSGEKMNGKVLKINNSWHVCNYQCEGVLFQLRLIRMSF
jgi:hypothetical protein